MTQGIYQFPLSANNIEDKLPPCNIEAEETVLGAILLDPNAIYRVKDRLKPEHFYISAHKDIYQACLRLCSREQPTDLLTVTNWLVDHDILARIGGRNKLATVLDRTVSAVNIDSLAAIIIEKAVRRDLIRQANEIIGLAYKEADLELPELSTLALDKIRSIVEIPIAPTKDEYQRWKHDRLLSELTAIYTTVPEPSLRFLKLKDLANEHHVTMNFLEIFYLKSLTAQCSKLLSYDELKTLAGSTVREWLLNGLVPKSTTILLTSDGGVGKTKFAYGLGKAIIQGQQFGQFHATGEKRRILYYQGDESPGDMLQALESLGYNESDINKYVRVRFAWSAENMPALIQDLKEFRPDFVVIDSLSTANRFSVYQESQMEYARPILEMTGLASEYKCTFVIIHHMNREGGVRGTTAIRNAVSEVWYLTKDNSQHGTPCDRLLEINKSRSRSSGKKYRMFFNPEDLTFTFLGEEGESGSASDQSAKERILKFLADHRNIRFACEELAHTLGHSSNYVRRVMGELAADGLVSVKQGKPNLYFLVQEGSQNPQKDQIQDQYYSMAKSAAREELDSSTLQCIRNRGSIQDHTENNAETLHLAVVPDAIDPQGSENQQFLIDPPLQEISEPKPEVKDRCGLEAPPLQDSSTDPGCDPQQFIHDSQNSLDSIQNKHYENRSSTDLGSDPVIDPVILVDENLPMFVEKCKYWSKSLKREVTIFCIFDIHSEVSCKVPGRGTLSLPFSDLQNLPDSPRHDLSVGDEVVILVGKEAETFATITDVTSDGIFFER